MEQTVHFIQLLLLATACVGAFFIYFVFKVLGFFVNATRLYRRMIRRLDATIKLLIDIRENTKLADVEAIIAELDDDAEIEQRISALEEAASQPILRDS